MKRLDPDAEDLRIASTISLRGCPFCGAQPIVFHEQNEVTGLVVSRVACTQCHGNVFSCGRDREEARKQALRDWGNRAHRTERSVDDTPRAGSPEGLATEVIAYLRDEADFNLSWTDGRRGDALTRGAGYVARRREVASQRKAWADAIEALLTAVAETSAAANDGAHND